VDHADHVALLRPAVTGRGGTWADIGSGTGAFTLALADLLGDGGRIVSIDRDERALREQAEAMALRFPGVALEQRVADFREPLDLPRLDGVVMANSLHFVRAEEQVAVVRRLASAVRPAGRFVVVEYDSDSGNPYVPFPFAAARWPRLAQSAGLVRPREIGRVPSRWLGAIYSAVAEVSAETPIGA
jgi:SAM-dependent methyltransferase